MSDVFVTFTTSLGDFVVDLYADAAPASVANFLHYVPEYQQDGNFFHRLASGFVLQGGGYRVSGGQVVTNATTTPVQNEFSTSRSNVAGTIAFAKLGNDPNSATDQFFFNLGDNASNLDSQNGGFTVFGRVVEGWNVVQAIAAEPVVNVSSSLGSAFNQVPVMNYTSGSITASNLINFSVHAAAANIVAPGLTATVVERASLTASALTGAVDTAHGDALSVTAIHAGMGSDQAVGAGGLTLAGAYGHLTIQPGGAFLYAADAEGLTTGQAYADDFTYTVADQHGGSVMAALHFTVTGSAMGTEAGNAIVGTGGNDILLGLAGDDTLTGAGGDDRLYGSAGFDTAVFAASLTTVSIGLSGDQLTVSGPDGNDTLFDLERLRFSDGGVDATSLQAVRAAYDGYFGRDPAAGELTYWGFQVQAGLSSGSRLEATLAATPEGRGHLPAVVADDYAVFLGRGPGADELAYWVNALGSGQVTPAQAQAVFAAQPNATTWERDAVVALYGEAFGRGPSLAERDYWVGQLASGGIDQVQLREVLFSSPEGEAHTAAVVTGDYQTWFGHAPALAEATYWTDQFHIGLDPSALRGILLDAPEGRAHTDAEIAGNYQTWFGRAPSGDEVATWEGLVRNGGFDFTALRDTLVNAPEGRAHTDAVVAAEYQTTFGRAPSSGEVSAWEGLIAGGHDFNELIDTLQSSAEANGHVIRDAGTPDADRFEADGAFGHVVLTGFTPASASDASHPADHFVFGDRGFDPLAHAVQTDALDGVADVLITYDAADTVLLKGVTLAALTHADFLFG